jgi:hypothetical protein
MSTRTRRTTQQKIPEQQLPAHAAGAGEPLPPPRQERRDRRRFALAITSVVAALGAAAAVLVLALTGDDGTTPAPDNQPFETVIPEDIDGSDARFYMDGPARGVPPIDGDSQSSQSSRSGESGESGQSSADRADSPRQLPGLNGFS